VDGGAMNNVPADVLSLFDDIFPLEVKSIPFRAFRVGRTQSKRSSLPHVIKDILRCSNTHQVPG